MCYLYFCTMLQHHPHFAQPQVCYFYLPPQNGKPAEVIAVINSISDTIRIPVPEEDVELFAFFRRNATAAELKRFGERPTWRIFDSWAQLVLDHQKYRVSPAIIKLLLECSYSKPLDVQYAMA